MYSVNISAVYNFENDDHSLEVAWNDSDGINVGAYSHGDSLYGIFEDICDQLDEAIAEYDDDKADVEESQKLEAKIAELQAQIDQLSAENETLKARHDEKIKTNKIKPDVSILDKMLKNNDFSDLTETELSDLQNKMFKSKKLDRDWHNLFTQIWGL